MKTYICNIPNFIKNFSKVLDYKTVLCDKIWHVLRDDQTNETYIFRQNGEILISVNGITSIGKFTILPMGAILIAISGTNYLIRPYNSELKDILAFNLDGTNQFSFLINEKSSLADTIKTHQQLENHYRLIEDKKAEYESFRKQREIAELEEKRKAERNGKKRKELISKYNLGHVNDPYIKSLNISFYCIIIIMTIAIILILMSGLLTGGKIGLSVIAFILLILLLNMNGEYYKEKSDKRIINDLLKTDISEEDKNILLQYMNNHYS